MDQNTQTITWLDEELRRAKSQLTEVRQRVESQAVELTDQAKRIQEMEGRLVGTQSKLTRFNVLEQSIHAVKEELLGLIREQTEDLSRYQREQAQGRQTEQESHSRAVNELKRSLEAIPPLQERLTILRAEDQRLGEALMSLQTRVTSHERSTTQLPERITYVEGQRAQDVKVVSQIQAEVVEALRRTEILAGKIEIVDDIARKAEQRITGLAGYREDLVKRQNQLAEEVRLREAGRDRQIGDWQGLLTHFEAEMGKQRNRMEQFAQRQDEAQQYLVAIDDYKEAINREQKQVTELQRMSEERQRRELEEWVAANEQRWTRFRLEREAHWHQQQSHDEEIVTHVKQLEAWREDDLERTHRIARELVGIREEYRAKLRELWAIHERAAVVQMDQVRRWYDEINGVVTEKIGEGRR